MREPDRVGGLFSLGPRLLVGRATLDAAQVLLPGALARYEYKVTLPEGTDAALFAADLQRSWPDAGWRARSPRDVQPQITRVTDRLATFLTLAGLTALLSGGLGIALTIETHLARRTGTIATLKSLGAVRRAGVHDLSGAGDAAGGCRRRAGLGFGPAAAAGGAAGARRRAADRPRSRRLCRAAAARGAGGAAHHLRVRGLALGDRARGVAGPPVSGVGHARAPLAAPALSGDDGRGGAGAGSGRDPGRPAARDRRLVRAHRGRGRTPALGHHPPVAARRQPPAASRRLRPAPRDRQPASAGLALAARDRGAGCGRHAAGGGGGARQQPQQRGGAAPADPRAGAVSDRRPAAAARRPERGAWPKCRAAAWSSCCPACAPGWCGSPGGPSPRSRSRTTSPGRSAATEASPMPRPCRTAPRSWPAAGGPPTMPGRPWSRSTRRSRPATAWDSATR